MPRPSCVLLAVFLKFISVSTNCSRNHLDGPSFGLAFQFVQIFTGLAVKPSVTADLSLVVGAHPILTIEVLQR